jgi:hypothetical protein
MLMLDALEARRCTFSVPRKSQRTCFELERRPGLTARSLGFERVVTEMRGDRGAGTTLRGDCSWSARRLVHRKLALRCGPRFYDQATPAQRALAA